MKIKSLIKLEVAITFLLLLYYMGGLGVQHPVGNNELSRVFVASQRNLIEKAMSALSYLLIPILISRKWKLWVYLITKDIPLFCLLFLANYSIIWADNDLSNNITSHTGLLLTTAFGVYLAARFSIKDQMRFLAPVFIIVILLSIFAALFLPGYGTHGGHLSGWTGVFQHKNLLGAYMAWSASVFLALSLSISRKYLIRFALWTGFAFSLLLVFLSGSAGGIINLICVISIVPLSKFIKKTYYKIQVLLISSIFLLVTCTFFLVVANLETIAQSLGKDLTFSGRVPMWSRLLDYVAQKPFFGYGFNGFWQGEYGANFRAGWSSWKTVPHSHNGFLELILALGLVGFALFMASCVFLFIRSYKEVYLARRFEDILPLQFLCTFILANLSESRLLTPNNIYWIFYVTMSLSLARKHIHRSKSRAD